MRLGSRKIRLGLFAASAAILVALVILPALASGDPGEISAKGKVTVSGTPVAGIEVCLDPIEEGVFGFCTNTNSAGEWESLDMVPGDYRIEFSAGDAEANVAPRYWQNAKRRADATLVKLEPEQTKVINETLTEAGGVIEGEVRLAADGNPLEHVSICAQSEEFHSVCTTSQANGEYFIYGIPTESIVVRFAGFNGAYEFQYFDHRLYKVQATRLNFQPGQLISNVDADMRVGGSISGHIHSPDGLPLPEIEACAFGVDTPEPVARCEFSKVGGAYTIGGLPPATYKVGFSVSPSDGVPGLDFSFFEDDGWPSQFWNLRRSLALGETITLAPDQAVGGIDAKLGVFVDPPPVVPTPVSPAPIPPLKKKPLKCKAGKHKVTVKKGKRKVTKCVKRKKHHKSKHRHAR